jgi:hypothetical protein
MRPITSQMPPPRCVATSLSLGNSSKIPHHHRHVEVATQLEERLRLVVVRIGMLVARADHHAFHAIYFDRPFQLLEIVVAPVGDRARKRIDFSGMLVLLLGQIFVDLAVLGEDRLGLRMAHIGGVIADDRDVDAVSFLRGEHVLDRHRAAPLPAGCRRLFGRIDVRMNRGCGSDKVSQMTRED